MTDIYLHFPMCALRIIWKRSRAGGSKTKGPSGEQAVCVERFVATGSLQLLDTLATRLPNHCLLLADFDALPVMPTSPFDDLQPPLNSPVVSSKGGRQDYLSYLLLLLLLLLLLTTA